MKINQKILNIPPYISTSWKSITSLHIEEKDGRSLLIVSMKDGSRIAVPDLGQTVIDSIFDAHAKFLEAGPVLPKREFPLDPTSTLGFPLRIGAGGIESIGSVMQHNPDQANSPNLPPEVLEKVAAVARALGIDNPESLPRPEPHCNCMHCQIARVLHGDMSDLAVESEESVTDEDLKFRQWDIRHTEDKLYFVSNPLDDSEQYSVFLGEPLGCTCGKKNCEHIRAVLES